MSYSKRRLRNHCRFLLFKPGAANDPVWLSGLFDGASRVIHLVAGTINFPRERRPGKNSPRPAGASVFQSSVL
ncbi:hypothetical protein GN956_G13808 [Arapaima gigas]